MFYIISMQYLGYLLNILIYFYVWALSKSELSFFLNVLLFSEGVSDLLKQIFFPMAFQLDVWI